ncbi:unnamed protein product [Cuscuta europaea]|uniref:Uncharacterized protein n=1 Tax=Cuscuta europaea TaxID=41803 RepID=A0A9P0ZRX2_CUSEU|nr:unnamed protein product [Cuscuta europaea]
MVKRRREEADSDDGAIVVAAPEARHRTVYIDTNLDTHLAVMVSSTDTVSYIKKEILVEHLDAFPHMGEIKIHSVQVKRKGNFYHLPDSMPIATVFEGIKRDWFIYVIGSVSVDQALNGACNDHIGSLHTKSYDQNVLYDPSIDLRMDTEHAKDEHCRYFPSDTCRSSAYKNIVSIAQVKTVSHGLRDHNSGDSSKQKPVTKRRKLKHSEEPSLTGGDDGSQKFQMVGNETSAKSNDRKSKLSLMPSDNTRSGRDDGKRPKKKKSKKIEAKDQFETEKSEKMMANVEADGDKMNENDERISRTTNVSVLENNEADLTNKGGRDDDKRSKKKKSKKIRAKDQFKTKKSDKMMANVNVDKMNENDERISRTNNETIRENNEAGLSNKGETDHDKRPKKKKSKKMSVKHPFEPNTGNNDQTLVPKFSEPVNDNTAKVEHLRPHSQTCQTIKALKEEPSEKHVDMQSESHISLILDMADLNSEQPETVHNAQLSDANATEKHGSPAGKKRKSKKSRTTYQDSFNIDPSDVPSGLPTVVHFTDGSNNQKLPHCIEIENPSNKQPIDTSAACSHVEIDKDNASEAGLLRPNGGFNEQNIQTGTSHLEQPETFYKAKLSDANATEKHGSPAGTKKKRKSKKSRITNQDSFTVDPSDVPSGLPTVDHFTDGCNNQNLSHCMEVKNPSNKIPIDTSAASSRKEIDKVNESEAGHLPANDGFNKQDVQTGTSHLEQPETVYKEVLTKRTSPTNSESILENSEAEITNKGVTEHGKRLKKKKSKKINVKDPFEPNTGNTDPRHVPTLSEPVTDNTTKVEHLRSHSQTRQTIKPFEEEPSEKYVDMQSASHISLIRDLPDLNSEQPETVYKAQLSDANATEKHGSPAGSKKKRKSKKSRTTNQDSSPMDPSDVPSGLPTSDHLTDGSNNLNLLHCMEIELSSNKQPIDICAARSGMEIDKVNESEAGHLPANDRFNKQDVQTGTSHLEQPETVYKEVLTKRTSPTNSESILENSGAEITNKGVTEHGKRLKKKKSKKINVKDPFEPNTGNTDPRRVPTLSEPVTDNTTKVEHLRPHSQTHQTIKPFEEEPSEKYVDMESASHISLIRDLPDLNSEQPETVYEAQLSDANATEKHGSPAGSKKKRKSKKSRTTNQDSSPMDPSDVPSGLPTSDHLTDRSNNLNLLHCMEIELSSNKQPIDICAARSGMEIDKVTESEAEHLRANNGLSEQDIRTGTSHLDAQNKDEKENIKSKRNNNTAGESLAILAKSDHEVCAEKMVPSNDQILVVDHPPNVAEVSGTAIADHIRQVSVADVEIPESEVNSGQACGNLEGNREIVLQGEVSSTEDGEGINFRRYFVPSSQKTKGASDKVEKAVTLSMDTTATGEKSANGTVPSIPGGLGNTPAHDENLNDENNRSSGCTELGKAKYDKHEKVKLHSNKKSPKISETDINGSNTFHQAEKPILHGPHSKKGVFASVSENKLTLDESSSTPISSQKFNGSIKDSSQPHSNHRSLASQSDARKTTEVNPTHSVAPKDKISHLDGKNENGDVHSKFPTQTPSSDSSSSSVDGSESSHHSTKNGPDGVKENNSHGESNLKSSLSGVKNLTMDAILRRSKRFKVAKQKAAKQLESDPESQPILVQSVKDNNSLGESNLKSSFPGAQNSNMHANLRRSKRFEVVT